MELLKTGLAFKKTVKASLESFSGNIGKHFMRIRKRRQPIWNTGSNCKKDTRSESIKCPEKMENTETHWQEALDREKLRLIIHSQSLTMKGIINYPEDFHSHGNFNASRKPRLPTPPSSPKRRQFQNMKTQQLTKCSGDWYGGLSKCESDDSGNGDSEWSNISESSTRSCCKHNFDEDKQHSFQLNIKSKASSKLSKNRLSVLRMAEDNIRQKISQNHDEIYSFLECLSNSVRPNQLQKISSYVADIEKITILLHSLARRLAAAELKIKLTKFNILSQDEKEEWRRKHIKLAQQLEEAKDIKDILDKKYQAITNFLEKYKGVETRIQFGNLMEDKIKLIITFKEVEDKIKMEDRRDSCMMQSITI